MPKLRQMLLPLLAITLTQAFLTLRAQAKSPVPSVRLDVTCLVASNSVHMVVMSRSQVRRTCASIRWQPPIAA
jgi:hypothetical protein